MVQQKFKNYTAMPDGIPMADQKEKAAITPIKMETGFPMAQDQLSGLKFTTCPTMFTLTIANT